MNKINGNARFTAIQEDTLKGGFLLVFYENEEDVGKIEKSCGIVEFASWTALKKWIVLQSSLVHQIDALIKFKENAKFN